MPREITIPEITFPDVPAPRWVASRDCVAFPAIVDGRAITCFVAMEFLLERFGLSVKEAGFGDAELRVFGENREAIQKTAAEHIEAGELTPNGEVVLTTNEFRLKDFHLSPSIHSSGRFLAVRAATSLLESILGADASHIVAEWDEIEILDEKDGTAYTLRLTDAKTGMKSDVTITAAEFSSPGRLQYMLAKLWGEFLQALSRRHLRELEKAQ